MFKCYSLARSAEIHNIITTAAYPFILMEVHQQRKRIAVVIKASKKSIKGGKATKKRTKKKCATAIFIQIIEIGTYECACIFI